MESCPFVAETVAFVMPAVVKAEVSAVAYCATVSPDVTVGAVMVAVDPVDVCPVIFRLVVGSTVELV